MAGKHASVRELAAAVDADPPPRPTGDKGRWLYVVMAQVHHGGKDASRPTGVAAYLTRQEAEQRVHGLQEPEVEPVTTAWVDAVPLDL